MRVRVREVRAAAAAARARPRRLRSGRKPFILAVGFFYLVGPTLESARRIRDWFHGGLWQTLFAIAVAALLVVVFDDRRVRLRLREHRARREEPDMPGAPVIER